MSPISPCGFVMDYLRSCYQTGGFAFDPHSGLMIPIDMQWYFTGADFPILPVRHQYASAYYTKGVSYSEQVGEIPGWINAYRNGQMSPGQDGSTYCGDEWTGTLIRRTHGQPLNCQLQPQCCGLAPCCQGYSLVFHANPTLTWPGGGGGMMTFVGKATWSFTAGPGRFNAQYMVNPCPPWPASIQLRYTLGTKDYPCVLLAENLGGNIGTWLQQPGCPYQVPGLRLTLTS